MLPKKLFFSRQTTFIKGGLNPPPPPVRIRLNGKVKIPAIGANKYTDNIPSPPPVKIRLNGKVKIPAIGANKYTDNNAHHT